MATRNRSFADYLTAWTRLMQSIEENQPILPDLTFLTMTLQGLINELTVITARQDAHRAGMQADTQRLNELMVRGRDTVLQLRGVIVSHLGPRNPKLAEFRVRPLGKPRALPQVTPDPVEAPAA
ncbi:MAG TPA: hypothetical protein VN493_26505 [Thermoanaerobaculia bacterium]|nr:hypothetical protein [Thermoanaerobaculia bacterium]